MASFLERYQAGQRVEVWDELRALGDAVREPRYYEDAWAVAVETMGRVRSNVELLIERLRADGYEFHLPGDTECRLDQPHAPPNEETPEFLAWLEELCGPLALSARAWIAVVGDVSLVGNHPRWPYEYMATDALVVQFELRFYKGSSDSREYHEFGYESWQEWVAKCGIEECGPYEVVVAPDMWHKICTSGGPAYGIVVPDLSADATFDGKYFVDYLRTCFAWGGFPGFGQWDGPNDNGTLEALKKDLLPI